MKRSWQPGYGDLDETAGEGGLWFAAPVFVPSPNVIYADPRQGMILYPDTDPFAVDPRMGSIIGVDTSPLSVDPRMGSIIGISADPRQGTIIL